ncbi:MAG: hypothetical protein CVV27_02680 [Candidatus Melainabacteria bacterium HGW-Melainabacteria-1]|nr:MAG: hypothetical protein CVV27_02680 [Candidatus Melainabacteria bacterium HGW-Melainabacteria-1]
MNTEKILLQTAHRPWPLPPGPWVMTQSWCDLLFAHWPIDPALLRPLIPAGIELDTFDGKAWIGVVPFRMENVTPRGVPAMPWISAFPELNVRTYVSDGSKPGVWFFSLDCSNPVAVRVARAGFHLPYYDARMALQRTGDWVRYSSHRTHSNAHPADLRALYRPRGRAYLARSGSLEHWLTERYCLYANGGGRLWRGEIQHLPWPLQRAEADFELNTMALPIGLRPAGVPLLHFVRRIDVLVWPLAALDAHQSLSEHMDSGSRIRKQDPLPGSLMSSS